MILSLDAAAVMDYGRDMNKTANDLAPLSTNEALLLGHIQQWGSSGYPIRKTSGGGWFWDNAFGVSGSPIRYRTKRAAVAAFEVWCDLARARFAAMRRDGIASGRVPMLVGGSGIGWQTMSPAEILAAQAAA